MKLHYFSLVLFPKKNLLILCSYVHNVSLFSPAAFKIFLSLALSNLIMICLSLHVSCACGVLSFLDSNFIVFIIFRKFKPLFLQIFFSVPTLLSSPETPFIHILGCLKLSHDSLVLSSCNFFNFFFSVFHFGYLLLLCLQVHSSLLFPDLIRLNSIQCIYLLHTVAFISTSICIFLNYLLHFNIYINYIVRIIF